MGDQELIDHLESIILYRAGGLDILRRKIPEFIDEAITFVIESVSGRTRFDQLDKTEKTFIATRVEILLREFLKVPKGDLDMLLAGIDVDTKYTCRHRGNWMIPPEQFGKACVLIGSSEKTKSCHAGLFIAHEVYLSKSVNRDRKHQVSKEGRKHIKWMLEDEPLTGKRHDT